MFESDVQVANGNVVDGPTSTNRPIVEAAFACRSESSLDAASKPLTSGEPKCQVENLPPLRQATISVMVEHSVERLVQSMGPAICRIVPSFGSKGRLGQ